MEGEKEEEDKMETEDFEGDISSKLWCSIFSYYHSSTENPIFPCKEKKK